MPKHIDNIAPLTITGQRGFLFCFLDILDRLEILEVLVGLVGLELLEIL